MTHARTTDFSPPALDSIPGGPEIVLIDDDPESVRVFSLIFKQQGKTMETFPFAQAFCEKYPHPVAETVICEVELSMLDEQTHLAGVLRDGGFEGRILGTSSILSLQIRAECIENGMDDYIPKPTEKDILRIFARPTVAPDEFE